jgi:Protein of unknown function (DUF3667)
MVGLSGMEQRPCRNCGTPVTGEYCSQCGQREGRAEQRFLDLAGELTGDVVDLDSRFWRTLLLLVFRPGVLSAEFIAGRRARYLPPLRLYLIISFIMFLVISFDTANVITTGDESVESDQGDVVVTLDSEDIAEAFVEEGENPEDWDGEINLADENSPQWLQELDTRAEQNITKLKGDPNEFVETMVSYLPQMMFLLLPLFALLVRLAYLLSPFHYLQHLVFSLHYHSFVYLLYLIAKLIELAGAHVGGWLLLALFIYLPLAFHRTYGSRFGAALGKAIFVYISYGVLMVQGFFVVALMALVLL